MSFWGWLKDARMEYRRVSSEDREKSLGKAAAKQERRAASHGRRGNRRTAGKAARNADALRAAEERERQKREP